MKVRLFCDEDTGTSVPRALAVIGAGTIQYPKRLGWPIRKGTPDTEWLTFAGSEGYLVFSCNTSILEVEEERETLIREEVGIVFLSTGQELKIDTLRLLLNRWEWIRNLWMTEPRPFAFRITIRGRITRIDLGVPPTRGGAAAEETWVREGASLHFLHSGVPPP